MAIVHYDMTVQGASHRRNNTPCEDASASWNVDDADGIIFAVADGHGDPACIRSAQGSKLVLEVVHTCLVVS